MFENYQPHEVFLKIFEKISTFIARESGIST